MDKDNEKETESSEDEQSSEEQACEEASYTIRPTFSEKFNPAVVKQIIKGVLIDELEGKNYKSINVGEMSKHMSQLIIDKLQSMPYNRYKYVVQVWVTENRGQGIKLTSSACWDPDTDNIAYEHLKTEDLFCTVAVSAVYFY